MKVLGYCEGSLVLIVPGGGDFDDIVAAGEGGGVDGAAAGLGVGDDGVPPVIIDGHIVGDIGIINNGDYIRLTVVEYIWHVGRNVHFIVRMVFGLQDNIFFAS